MPLIFLRNREATRKINRQLKQQTLMTYISQRFLSGNDLDSLISETFKMVGEFMGAAQILIYVKDGDGVSYVCKNEWINPKFGLKTRIGGKFNITEPLKNLFTGLKDKEKFYIVSTDPVTKEIMAPYRLNFQNYIATSIFIEDKLYAVLDFSREDESGQWNQDDIHIFSFISNILKSAFHTLFINNKLITAKELAERQNSLLYAANKATALLLDISTESFTDTLTQSMRILAEAIDIHRVCIWKNHMKDGQMRCALLHEWISELRPPVTDYYTVDASYDESLPGWYELLSKGKDITNHIGNMTADEQEQLKPQHIKSLYVTPLFVKDAFWGYVGFDDCLNDRVFTENEAMILRSAGYLIGNAFLRNEMERETIEALTEARNANRAKSVFLSHMSHEIRTPMNAVLGISEIQLQDPMLSPETGEAFSKIYEAGNILLNIINDILDFSKIDAGKMEIVPDTYDIPSLLNDTVQLNRLRYESKPLEFKLEVDENTPLELIGDELRIRQILNNILSNAFKYTETGKIKFSVTAEPGHTHKMVTLIFRVSDTGQGMNKNQIERLFDDYSRFNLETNRNVTGTGLGMSITKNLVTMMDGEISVESEPGRGSVFTVRLPQERAGTDICGTSIAERLQNFNFRKASISKKAQFIYEYMPYGSVLVVDDVETNLFVARGLLIPYGLQIDTAGSGFEAIEKIKNNAVYDIIFMDHMMPKMDGMKTTRIIRDMGYTHPIIALTANAVSGQADVFLKNGFDAFISKPIDSRNLNLLLINFIRERKSPDIVEAARLKQNEKMMASAIIRSENEISEMKKYFVLDAENAVDVMNKTIAASPPFGNEDLEAYFIVVHGIKSALAVINETELSGIALKLEQAGMDRNHGLIADETPAFIDALQLLIQGFKSAGTDEDAEITSYDPVLLRKKLHEIKTACEIFDIETIETILAELKQETWPRKINDILNEISLNLLRGEFKKIVSAAEDSCGVSI